MTALNKAEIPLMLLLLPFLAGLTIGIMFPFGGSILWLYILFYVVLGGFVVLNMAYRKFNIYKVKWTGGVLVNLMLLIGGVCCLESHRETNFADHFSKVKSDYLIVRVNNEPKQSDNMVRFTAVVEQAGGEHTIKPVTGNLMISVKVDSTSKNKFVYGDELLIPANFTPVEPPLNPAEFN